MTRRLRQYNRHFSVEWLGNHQVSLTADEQWLVDAPTSAGICREVILHGDLGPALLGWTLFADVALEGSGLADLGEQPLGERVFGHEPARRDHLQLARFEIAANPRCPAATVWGVVPSVSGAVAAAGARAVSALSRLRQGAGVNLLTKERGLAYMQLARVDKPIGSLLLLWPTLWALWLAAGGLPNLWVLTVLWSGSF